MFKKSYGFWRCLPLLFAALILLGFPCRAETGLLMPMYGNDAFQIMQVYNAAAKVPVIAILNPDDGVGWKKNSWLAAQVSDLQRRGVRVIGYIDSEYGWRDPAEVDDESDKYKIWYHVNGLFIDEVRGESSKLNYYKSIRAYAKLIGIGFTVLNPGTPVSSSFLAAGDVIVDYEHADWQMDFPSTGTASWVPGNASRAAGIIYGVGEPRMWSIVNAGVAKGYGWLYVTNHNEPDPFGISASYFDAEVDYIHDINHPDADPFRILSSELGAATPGGVPDRMKLLVKTKPGRTYEVQCSTTLAPGSWHTASQAGLPDVPLRAQVNTPQQLWEAALIPGATQCFYRVAEVTPYRETR